MHTRFIIWFTIAGLLLGLVGPLPQAAYAMPNALPLQQVQPDDYVNLEWNIVATGHLDRSDGIIHDVRSRSVEIRGSALIRVPKEGLSTAVAQPMFLTIEDQYDEVETGPCQTRKWHTVITDPSRWSGGPDYFWVLNQDFRPFEMDGKLQFVNPFGGPFYLRQTTSRTYTYQEDYQARLHGGNCGSGVDERTTQEQKLDYVDILSDMWQYPLLADSTGTVFTLHKEMLLDRNPMDLQVTADITAHKICTGAAAALAAAKTEEEVRAAQNVCGCGALPKNRPIPDSHPAINNLKLEFNGDQFEITPDQVLVLHLDVTCEGVPVTNTELEATLLKPQLMGHAHGKSSLGRGYLDDQLITGANPTINIRTDEKGGAFLVFSPPDDLRDHERGVAGRYDIAVRSVRFPFSTAQAPVIARYPLNDQATGGIFWQVESNYPPGHTNSKWATLTTLVAINAFSDAFVDFQDKHNAVLEGAGLDAWTVALVRVGAVSLPWGGLFDSSLFTPWRPPFEKHLAGGEVLFLNPYIRGYFPDEQVAEAEPLLRAAYQRIGSRYGTWYTDWGSPLNMAIGQPEPGANATSTTVPDAVGPDLGVTAFRTDPLDAPIAVAGQLVTYTFGVDNYFGDTNANDSALSVELPAGLAFVSANPAPTSQNGQQIEWAVGTVEPVADFKLFNAVLQVAPSVSAGSLLTVTAEVTTSSNDAKPADNHTTAPGLLIQATGPDVAVEAELPPVAPGDLATIPVTIGNYGNATAATAALEVTLPVSSTFQNASVPPTSQNANRLTWDFGALSVEATRTVSITLLLDPDLAVTDEWGWPEQAGSTLSYQFKASGTPQDIVPANNLLELEQTLELPGHDASVVLNVQGAKAPALMSEGEEVTYTIAYGNRSEEVAANSVISLSLWSGLEFLSATPAPTRNVASESFGGGVRVWEMGDLDAADQGFIQVRVRVNDVPQFGNFVMAEIQAEGSDRSPANNFDTTSHLAATGEEVGDVPALFMPIVVTGK